MNSRLARNNAVQDKRPTAAIDYEGFASPVSIATGHLEDVSAADAMAYAKEHDDEIKQAIDDMAVHERGGDGVGYVTIEDGEIVSYTIYAQYQR